MSNSAQKNKMLLNNNHTIDNNDDIYTSSLQLDVRKFDFFSQKDYLHHSALLSEARINSCHANL